MPFQSFAKKEQCKWAIKDALAEEILVRNQWFQRYRHPDEIHEPITARQRRIASIYRDFLGVKPCKEFHACMLASALIKSVGLREALEMAESHGGEVGWPAAVGQYFGLTREEMAQVVRVFDEAHEGLGFFRRKLSIAESTERALERIEQIPVG